MKLWGFIITLGAINFSECLLTMNVGDRKEEWMPLTGISICD